MTPTEQAAVDRLRRVTRRCACRGDLTADPRDPADVTTAVLTHQQAEEHRLWAAAGGMDQMLTPRERHRWVPDALIRRVG